MSNRTGPAPGNISYDLNFIYVSRVALAAVLAEKWTRLEAKRKLIEFGALCNACEPNQGIEERVARNYLAGQGVRSAPWKFRRQRKTELLSALGFDKSEYPSVLAKIGFGQDHRPTGSNFKEYAPDPIPIGGQLRLRVLGSKSRILEKDNLPDASGRRTAGPFGRVDVRVERCEIYTDDNLPYDKPRNYVRVTYPDDTGVGKSSPGVVNLMYLAHEKKFALVATVRPAVRKICVEAIRGFPDQWDKSIRVNGIALSVAMFAALREAGEEGGVMVLTDDHKLAIEPMSENFADTGKLADSVAFFISSFETLGEAWKSAEPWQLGIVLVEPLRFLATCAAGGGKIRHGDFEFRSRFSGDAAAIYQPKTVYIEDMFTLLAGNLAIQKLSGPLRNNAFFKELAEDVVSRFKRNPT